MRRLFASIFIGFFSLNSFASPAIESAAEVSAAGHQCAARIIALGTAPQDADVQAAFTQCLGSYVRVHSLDPAHEALAVAFWAAAFEDLGIPTLQFTTPGQAGDPQAHPNLVATLTASNAALGHAGREAFDWANGALAHPSVILLNHVDVVPVQPEQWESPDLTFAGDVAPSSRENTGEQYLWGRGSIDMKGIGMLQAFSMAWLKQQGAALDKDIHFLAVADEEKNSSGAIGAVAEIKSGGKLAALAGAQVELGEGGMGTHGAVGSRTTMHMLNNEEKGGAWLRLRSSSVADLFNALEQMKVLGTRHRYLFHARYGCSLTDANTPNAAVNVIASKVVITLRCDRSPRPTDLQKVFEEQAKGLTVSVETQPYYRYQVTLQTATSAHAALSVEETLLQGMSQGLAKLGVIQRSSPSWPSFYDYKKTAATEDLLNVIGSNETFGRLWGDNYILPTISKLGRYLPESLLGKFGGMLFSEGLFRTTCNWTTLGRVDDQFEATLDCRLLRPTSSQEFLGTVRGLVGAVDVTPVSLWDFSQSPADTWSFQAIKRVLESEAAGTDRVAVAQWLAPNGSDNNFFRNPRAELGQGAFHPIDAYGFFPIVVPTSIVSTQHGSNERFPVTQMAPGVRRYLAALRALTGHG